MDTLNESRDLRNTTVLYCGKCGAKLELIPGKYSLYYRCMRYDRKNRAEGEKSCPVKISLTDAELLYTELENLEFDGDLQNGVKGRVGNVNYTVRENIPELVRVEVTRRQGKSTFRKLPRKKEA